MANFTTPLTGAAAYWMMMRMMMMPLLLLLLHLPAHAKHVRTEVVEAHSQKLPHLEQ